MSALLVSLIFGVAIPILAMAALVPFLQHYAPHSPNFHGVEVFTGLGVAWFIWLVGLWSAQQLLLAIKVTPPHWLLFLIPLAPLLAGTCVFGLFDDWAGDRTSKGFRGHLRALSHGRLTTGGLKFLGIGLLSLVVAFGLFYVGPATLPKTIVAALVMALSANLINLFDLRPGRASKVYVLCLAIVLPLVIFVHAAVSVLNAWEAVALALAVLGPVFSTWRFDIKERGMLGDIGANSMGALVGYLLVLALPLWALVIVMLALLAINLLSERYSFSRIIESVAWLRALDHLGRKEVR